MLKPNQPPVLDDITPVGEEDRLAGSGRGENQAVLRKSYEPARFPTPKK
jgi:hypothetical protein